MHRACRPLASAAPLTPAGPRLHVLTPDEVSVQKGGEVTFQIHGGGHGFAIYEVSKNTTRSDIGPQLCAGDDPATIPLPGTLHTCNLSADNANAKHIVRDAKGDVVLVAEANPTRYVSPPTVCGRSRERFMSAGGQQFLNGGTIPAGATSNGQLLTYQFLEDRPLPGAVHQSRPLPERLDVRLRRRPVTPAAGRRSPPGPSTPLRAGRIIHGQWQPHDAARRR